MNRISSTEATGETAYPQPEERDVPSLYSGARRILCSCASGLSLAITATGAAARDGVNKRIDESQGRINTMNAEPRQLKKQVGENTNAAARAGPGKTSSTSTTRYDDGLKFADTKGNWNAGVKWIPIADVHLLIEYIETRFGNAIIVNGVQGDEERAANLHGQIDS